MNTPIQVGDKFMAIIKKGLHSKDIPLDIAKEIKEHVQTCPENPLVKQIEQLQAVVNDVKEALAVLNRLRLLYYSSGDMFEESTQSATKLLMKHAKEGLRIAKERRQQEYIDQLQAELKEKDQIIEALEGDIELLKAKLEDKKGR